MTAAPDAMSHSAQAVHPRARRADVNDMIRILREDAGGEYAGSGRTA